LHVLIDSTGLQVYGAGQWLQAKHGAKSRRTWRKLLLAVDAASGRIGAQTLTDQDVDDPSQVGSLLRCHRRAARSSDKWARHHMHRPRSPDGHWQVLFSAAAVLGNVPYGVAFPTSPAAVTATTIVSLWTSMACRRTP
jgi:hypothetical protein